MNCPKCYGEVHPHAEKCRHCGSTLIKNGLKAAWLVVLFGGWGYLYLSTIKGFIFILLSIFLTIIGFNMGRNVENKLALTFSLNLVFSYIPMLVILLFDLKNLHKNRYSNKL